MKKAIFFSCFAFYMMTSSRERPWGDAHTVYDVAESIVDHGGVDVPTRWPIDAPPGRKGKFYALNPLLTSLVYVPGVAVNRALLRIWPSENELILRFTCHLAPAAAGALTCLLFFLMARRFTSIRAASLTTAILAVATAVWVYARYPYTEILQTACFTGFFAELLRTLDDPADKRARWLGFWAGALINTKLVYFLALPGAFLLLAYRLRAERQKLLRVMAWGALTFAPWMAMVVFYNYVRFGSLTNAGYKLAFSGPIWVGLLGMFMSPGKSVFLYNAPLVLSIFGVPHLVRRYPWMATAMAVTILPLVLLYARFLYWSGDYAWGPRYLVFAIPVVMLPAAFTVDAILDAARRRWRIAALAIVVAAGVVVQVLGNALYWDHYIRIVREASPAWLGPPNRSGATLPDRGGICDACFEDLYGYEWLPPFQPIVGHWWLAKHVARDDNWQTAEADAPWHMYTKLKLPIAGTYARARIDWWTLDYGDRKRSAAILWVLMSVGFGLSVWRWWIHTRRLQTT